MRKFFPRKTSSVYVTIREQKLYKCTGSHMYKIHRRRFPFFCFCNNIQVNFFSFFLSSSSSIGMLSFTIGTLEIAILKTQKKNFWRNRNNFVTRIYAWKSNVTERETVLNVIYKRARTHTDSHAQKMIFFFFS